MFVPVYAKPFLDQLRTFNGLIQEDVKKTIIKIRSAPNLDPYRRYYLSPYLQEHPHDTRLILIFREVPGTPKKLFFAWLNDFNHPHDTRGATEDPCLVEFARLQTRSAIEIYDKDYHEGKFNVDKPSAPHFSKFKKYKNSVRMSIFHDGTTYYAINAIAESDEPEELYDHYSEFFMHLRHHFVMQNKAFEIRPLDSDTIFLEILKANLNRAHWKYTLVGADPLYEIVL